MPGLIEDYAIIGNCESAAMMGRDGSIDWLALPRFDSAACFAALLGTSDNGRWQIAPRSEAKTKRRYRQGTLILETSFETVEGQVVVIDGMGRHDGCADLVRLVRCERGRVPMRMELVIRCEYGSIVPWVRRLDDGRLTAVAGPDRLTLSTPVRTHGENMRTVAEFTIKAGQEIPFVLTWSPSFRPIPDSAGASDTIEQATTQWRHWARSYKVEGSGEWSEVVLRSLITLKALTHLDTGGIVAAATTSLPEQLGGPRNWDYRFCWLRDATLTLYALLNSGFLEEAAAWRDWLLRAVAGSPAQMQIMYGIAGERRLIELEIPWLKGYENAAPVRAGNVASDQLQLDVYGEVLDALYQARRMGLAPDEAGWRLERELVEHLEKIWHQPDEGVWEVRAGRRQFTHSKVMAWVAFDGAIRSAEEFKLPGPADRWRRLREHVHEEVCRKGFDPELNSFVQSYGAKLLDASLLLLPLVGFLPADDPRITGTLAAIERHLLKDGFVARYNTESAVDGLPGDEGAFLACSFWLPDNYILQGREEDARAVFQRLLDLRNDVGLLAEEYDPRAPPSRQFSAGVFAYRADQYRAQSDAYLWAGPAPGGKQRDDRRGLVLTGPIRPIPCERHRLKGASTQLTTTTAAGHLQMPQTGPWTLATRLKSEIVFARVSPVLEKLSPEGHASFRRSISAAALSGTSVGRAATLVGQCTTNQSYDQRTAIHARR